MKALSFLGTSEYQPVTYVWREDGREKEFQTHLFPEAIAQIFRPEELVLFVTKESKAKYEAAVRERLGDSAKFVDIPEGKSEPELWAIFDRCVESVDEGDQLLLDVTHAFRSLPLLIFAVAAYLRRTKGVTVNRIVYGAYEAREPFRTPPDPGDRAPIFDLTPLLDLLDWLSGAEAFLQRGDATLLAQRLDQAHRRPWVNREAEDLPRRLQKLGNKLQALSLALHLSRPLDIMRHARDLVPLLDEAAAEVERWAKPFAVILQRVREEARQLAHGEPLRLDSEHLCKQLATIDYFLSRGLIAQAILLAREWLVSWVACWRGKSDWLDQKFREGEIESALGAAGRKARNKPAEVPGWFRELPQSARLGELWNQLTELRNDLAHCGMRKNAAPAPNIKQRAEELSRLLKSVVHEAPTHALWSGRVVIDLQSLYGEVAKLDELPLYLEQALEQASEGNEVVLTGQAPVWLYLAVAHALHGKARRVVYASPATGEVIIFDHSAK